MISARHALLVAIVALAGCNNSGQTNPLLNVAAGFVPALGAIPGVAEAPAASPGFSPDQIAANPDNYILIQGQVLGDPVLARRIAQNGLQETWLAQNGFSAVYRDGIMVATRGLGEDLIAATPSGIRAALRAGGGTGQRVHDYIGDQNEIIQIAFECTITGGEIESVNLGLREESARKYAEICRSQRLQFENAYWIDASGEILTSLQFVSQASVYVRRSEL